MRKAEFVPETAKCKDVLKEMTLKKTQMMVIADEYGGTSGIVTMEDLLEEIVGNIQDEYDDEEAEITQTEKNVFTVDGSADPEDIFTMLGLELPETNNYDTMSAFFVDRLGRIPDENESAEISYKNVKFTVLLTEDNWVSKIKAVVQNSDEEPAE
jgi:putative hemolysin